MHLITLTKTALSNPLQQPRTLQCNTASHNHAAVSFFLPHVTRGKPPRPKKNHLPQLVIQPGQVAIDAGN